MSRWQLEDGKSDLNEETCSRIRKPTKTLETADLRGLSLSAPKVMRQFLQLFNGNGAKTFESKVLIHFFRRSSSSIDIGTDPAVSKQDNNLFNGHVLKQGHLAIFGINTHYTTGHRVGNAILEQVAKEAIQSQFITDDSFLNLR